MGGVKSPQCAKCPLKPCVNDPEAEKPTFCPMVVYPEIVGESIKEYGNEFVRNIHHVSTLVEKEGMASGLGLGRSPSFVRGLILGGWVSPSV